MKYFPNSDPASIAKRFTCKKKMTNMFKSIKKACLIVLIIIPFFISAVQAETISLVADEWPPFNGVPDSNNEGFIVDVARTVFEKNGIHIVYEILPWKRAVEMTRKGLYSGIIGATKAEASDFIFPSEELFKFYDAFYVKKGSSWQFIQKNDIKHRSIGVIEGYAYIQWLLDYIHIHQNNLDRVQIMTGENPLERNILKLIDGRIDTVVDNENVILNVARQMNVLDQIVLAGYTTESSSIYIAFSPKLPKSKTYAKILSQGIVNLKETGEFKKILSKYGLKDRK
ncbi:transporter substrate-binding domain-containing protein [Desulfobacterales bacterium HSG17]|nr:transporter substrate-binding domain-containing protein [Desulfobacterales bacterium HSG17]